MSQTPRMQSSDISLRAATEPEIVMADSHTSRNVESPLVRPVVDSTTGVDASKSQDTPAVPGDTTTNQEASPSATPPTATINTKTETTTTTEVSENSRGRVSTRRVLMGGWAQSGTTTADPGSDVDRSGSASPSKLDRKTTSKKPSFKPVSLNKQFLKDTPAAAAAPASSSSATLLSKRMGPPVCAFGGYWADEFQATGLNAALAQPVAPRLIAASKLKLVRTGGSSQTSGPSGSGPGGIGSSKTEAQPVWNKNQRT